MGIIIAQIPNIVFLLLGWKWSYLVTFIDMNFCTAGSNWNKRWMFEWKCRDLLRMRMRYVAIRIFEWLFTCRGQKLRNSTHDVSSFGSMFERVRALFQEFVPHASSSSRLELDKVQLLLAHPVVFSHFFAEQNVKILENRGRLLPILFWHELLSCHDDS